jgi:hypothetical protein
VAVGKTKNNHLLDLPQTALSVPCQSQIWCKSGSWCGVSAWIPGGTGGNQRTADSTMGPFKLSSSPPPPKAFISIRRQKFARRCQTAAPGAPRLGSDAVRICPVSAISGSDSVSATYSPAYGKRLDPSAGSHVNFCVIVMFLKRFAGSRHYPDVGRLRGHNSTLRPGKLAVVSRFRCYTGCHLASADLRGETAGCLDAGDEVISTGARVKS